MNIVLIQPKAAHSWEALNLGYLKAYAQQFDKGWKFKFYSGYFDSDNTILEGCRGADFIGFSCTTPQLVHAKELIGKLRERNCRAKIIIGGVHASAQPRHVLPLVDYVVQGEGEMPLVAILQGKVKPGIIKMPEISKLDSLPYPDRDFIKQERNIVVTQRNDNERIGAISSLRGCPFKCAFCSSRAIWGKPRLHSAKRVVDEMEYLVKNWGIEFIKFSDDTFTLDEERVLDICRLKRIKNLDVEWGCNIRANTSENVLRKMKEAKCREVWIGAESGSPHVLREMRKGITVDMVENIFEVTKKLGFHRRVYFLLGWPTETEEDIELTRKLAEKIDADQYGFAILVPFPNTTTFQPWMLDGLDWANIDTYSNPWARTNTIDNNRLKEIQSEFKERFSGKMCFRQKEEKVK